MDQTMAYEYDFIGLVVVCSCVVKNFFKLEWYIYITNTSEAFIHFIHFAWILSYDLHLPLHVHYFVWWAQDT